MWADSVSADPLETNAALNHLESVTPERDLEPFKIVGHLIGVHRNAEGEIMGEEIMGEVAIYRPNFGRVKELVEEALDKAAGVP